MPHVPVLDGKIKKDPAWKDIYQSNYFYALRSKFPASKKTFFKMGYTPEALYIGVQCQEPEPKKIKAELMNSAPLWQEDSIELFVSPKPCEKYYQFVVNAISSRWSQIPLNWKAISHKGGIEKAVAFAPFIHLMPYDTWYTIKYKTERECNEWLYQSLKGYPNIFGFVVVNPKNPESCDILTEYIDKGFVGVKIHPPIFQIKIDNPSLDKFYSTAERLKVPVLFHTGVHGWRLNQYMPILLDNVAQKHPTLKIILEHMGGIAFFDQALAVLHNNKNIYAGITHCSERDPNDLKYAMSPQHIKILLDTVDIERIIYGLDYSFNDDDFQALRDDIKWIRSWNISNEAQEKILGGNLEKLLKR